MNALYSPAIPLVAPIPGGHVRPGESIIIQGEPLGHCNRFCVNLIDQSSSQCVFHLDFRFDQNTTVRNCNYGGSWGHEERSHLPVHKGQFFYMEIRASQDRYLVAINGQHHSEFVHRASYSAANALQIQGDVRIASVEFKNFPAPHGHHHGFYMHRLHAINPSIPFVSSINGHLMNGGEIQVHGRVRPNANRFSVNLQQGTHTNGQAIALHVNPRFEGGHRVIVLNSKSGSWAEEKRIDGHKNPFHPGGEFLLTLRRQADHFDIFVNGVHLKSFKHRMSADMVDAVYIEGDVTVDRVLAI